MKFNKKDLKTGMKVIARNRNVGVVLLGVEHKYGKEKDCILFNGNFNWHTLNQYTENLKYRGYRDEDIVEVFTPEHPYVIGKVFNKDFDTSNNEYVSI